MKRYVLTGAPGAGKTTILRALQAMGHPVVEEAATDVIAAHQAQGVAQPWTHPSFVDDIVELQRRRQTQTRAPPGAAMFFDRSPVCTLALGRYLGIPPSRIVSAEIERSRRRRIYQREVFFIDNLGFVERTEARRISFEESLAFEAIHRQVYEELGFSLVRVPPDEPQRRAELILRHLS
jgi:predicted ATPase